MRWPAAIPVLLLACALSKWLLASDIQIQDPSLAGMPLSDVEYDHFFKTLNSPRRVSAVCFLRTMYGCQNALIQTLDLYENHGIVPEGRVCSDLVEMPTFPDFCTLTFYRCTLKKYFVKRVQCPDEISKTPATTQNTSQDPGNTQSPSTPQETLLISILPTAPPTTRTSPALLTSASDTPTAATEATTTTVSAISSSVKPLLALEPTPTTTDSESLLELLTGLDAVIAEQSFPELFTTNGTTPTTTEMSFPQDVTVLAAVPSVNPAPALPSTSHATTAAPVTSVSIVTVSSSEPATTEAASPTSTTPTATDESLSQHLTVSDTEPSPSPAPTLPSTSHATTAAPVTSVSVVTVSSPEPDTTEVATLSVGSIPTNPATTVAPASSPTSAPPSPIITVTAPASLTTSSNQPCSVHPFSSSSTASKLSLLLMKPTTTKNPAHLSPPASVAHWPDVPISALLGQYPLQPTPIMQLFVLPSGFGPRKPKPQGAIAISPLLPILAGSANIWQKKKIPEPQMNTPAIAKLENFFLQMNSPTTAKLENFLQMNSPTTAKLENFFLQMNSPTTAKLENLQMNSPTTAKLEDFFLQLKDSRVQQLMQKMRELMTKGKAVKKQLLQSTSLQLLSALKHAKQKSSMVSLVAKKQLQR